MASTANKRKQGKGGRGSSVTDEFCDRVRLLASRGLNQRQVAIILGVDPASISIWKKRHDKFNKALAEGLAIGIERRLRRIEKAAAAGSWQADAWWLERVARNQFGKQLEISGPDGKPLGPQIVAPTVVFVHPPKRTLEELEQGSNGHPLLEAETVDTGVNGGENGH